MARLGTAADLMLSFFLLIWLLHLHNNILHDGDGIPESGVSSKTPQQIRDRRLG